MSASHAAEQSRAVDLQIDFATAAVPDLHARLARIRDAAAVAPVRFHGQRSWLVTTHAHVLEAFQHEDRFCSAAMHEPAIGRSIQAMRGEEHRANRALLVSAFTPAVMRRRVETLLEPIAHEVIDEFAQRGEVELIRDFAARFPFRVVTRLLGIPIHNESQIFRWAKKLLEHPWDPDGAKAAAEQFRSYLMPLVEQRRASPIDDLLSLLVHAEVEGRRLTDDQIFAFVGLLFPAGSDTSYKAIGSMMLAVLTRPELCDRLRADPAERRWVVEETLRWEPPVALLPRKAAKDTQLAGVDLPAGSHMLLGIAAANRDPEVFEAPDAFDPSRRSRQSLVFGWGVHYCLGSHLARREMEVALGVLLERLPGLRLVDPQAVEILGALLRGPRRLPARFDVRARHA